MSPVWIPTRSTGGRGRTETQMGPWERDDEGAIDYGRVLDEGDQYGDAPESEGPECRHCHCALPEADDFVQPDECRDCAEELRAEQVGAREDA